MDVYEECSGTVSSSTLAMNSAVTVLERRDGNNPRRSMVAFFVEEGGKTVLKTGWVDSLRLSPISHYNQLFQRFDALYGSVIKRVAFSRIIGTKSFCP